MPKYHIVLCFVESEGDGQIGNKQYLLFKVKGTACVGMKSNSVITKNPFNTFSFLSCLLLLLLLVSTSVVKTETIHGFYNLPVQSVHFSQQNSIILHHRWSGNAFCYVATAAASFWFSDSTLPLFVSSGLVSALAGFLLLSLSGLLKKHHHSQFSLLALSFSFHIQFNQFSWGYLSGKIFSASWMRKTIPAFPLL